jgi:hypothetical protein
MAEIRDGSAESRVVHYFRAKSRQLLATSELAVAEHRGLSGSHREELQRIYLREVIPRRYDVGRGMVYGLFGRSREADIVIWDSQNYPSLPLSDHSFYFAESVRVVIESKSRWSKQDWSDVRDKTRELRSIVLNYSPSLRDEIDMLQQDIQALQNGEGRHHGAIIVQHKIGTAAVFIEGGSDFLKHPEEIASEIEEQADDSWPDATLFLREGVLIFKNESSDTSQFMEFYRLNDDSLIGFTNILLRLLMERTVSSQGAFYLDNYMRSVIDVEPYARIGYQGNFWAPGRTPIW